MSYQDIVPYTSVFIGNISMRMFIKT